MKLPTREIKKVALYTRVSTGDQNTQTQVLALTKYCENRGWEIVKCVEENRSSGETRPRKNALYQRAIKNPFYDAIVVYRLDRWARSVSELINDIEILHNHGIWFISMTENIDFSTASGKLQFHMFASFAEFERSIIRERTMIGLARAKAQGKKGGRPMGRKDKLKGRRPKSGYYMRFINDKITPPLNDGVINE